jgi:hypothetical protein
MTTGAPVPDPGGVPAEIEALAWAPLRNRALHAAARLDVAGHLKDGPRTSEELAGVLGVDAGALYRLLRALESLGLFTEPEPGTFTLTASGTHLLADAPSRFRDRLLMSDDKWWAALGDLGHAVTTGSSSFTHANGLSYFDYLEQHADKAEIFGKAMTSMVGRMAPAVVAAYDFGPFATIVDVGGGHGILLASILRANPGARGILFDLPLTVEGAQQRLEEMGLADRCSCVGGSFFDAVPEGDLFILSAVLSDWDDDDCVRILTACRRAVRPGGRLLVLERLVRPDLPATDDAFMDLLMLVVGGGTGRSEAEYSALLARAGFDLVRVVPTGVERSIFEAAPV